METSETSETCGGALDMRVARAGHDKIPLARIERRVSLGARPDSYSNYTSQLAAIGRVNNNQSPRK